MTQQAQSAGPDLVRCWLQGTPARELPNLQGIPILIVVSEASYHAPYDHCTSEYLTQAGVKNDFVRLPELRHPRQRPHDDAREEQSRDRGVSWWIGRRRTSGSRHEETFECKSCTIAVSFPLRRMRPAAPTRSRYPVKPIRLVLPFPPGAPSDLVGRTIGQKMGEQMGQNFVPGQSRGRGRQRRPFDGRESAARRLHRAASPRPRSRSRRCSTRTLLTTPRRISRRSRGSRRSRT